MVLLTRETIVRHHLPNNLGKNVQIIASVIFCSILYVMKAFHHLTTDLLPLMFFTDIKCGGTNTNTNTNTWQHQWCTLHRRITCKVIIFWLENGTFEFSRNQYIFLKHSKRVLCKILLPFLKYAFHLTITFHYCCTRLKFDIFPDFYHQNRGGSKLTRGSNQVNLTLTETCVQGYFNTPFLNLKTFLKVHIKLLHKPIFWHLNIYKHRKNG